MYAVLIIDTEDSEVSWMGVYSSEEEARREIEINKGDTEEDRHYMILPTIV